MKNRLAILFIIMLTAFVSGGCLDVLKGDDGKDGAQGIQGEKGDPGDGIVDVFRHVVTDSESDYEYPVYNIIIRDDFFEVGCDYSLWEIDGNIMIKYESLEVADNLIYTLAVGNGMMYFRAPSSHVGDELLFIKTGKK